MKLGQLKNILESQDRDKLVVIQWKDNNGEIIEAYPRNIDSWRGIYAECAFSLSFNKKVSVEFVIDLIDFAISGYRIYEGYKGGEFQYDENTEIHVDNWGSYTKQEPLEIEISDVVKIIWKF
jgi:hypothetical protein